MTAFVAVSNLDTLPRQLGTYVDSMSATVEASRVIPLPAVTAQDPQGTHYELRWWLQEDGRGQVVIYRFTPSGRKYVQERYESFTVEPVRPVQGFIVRPPRRATDQSPAAAGAFWNDGTMTLCLIPSGEVVRLSTIEAYSIFMICSADAGFTIEKVLA